MGDVCYYQSFELYDYDDECGDVAVNVGIA